LVLDVAHHILPEPHGLVIEHEARGLVSLGLIGVGRVNAEIASAVRGDAYCLWVRFLLPNGHLVQLRARA